MKKIVRVRNNKYRKVVKFFSGTSTTEKKSLCTVLIFFYAGLFDIIFVVRKAHNEHRTTRFLLGISAIRLRSVQN